MVPPAAGKGALRRHWRAERERALAAGAGEAILAAAAAALPPLLAAGGRLGLYWPLAGEPDLRPLAGCGWPLALPAVVGSGGERRLIYRAWASGEPLVAVHGLLERNPHPDELEVKEALSGNICRCTGYGRIFAAVDKVIADRTGGAR